MKKTILIIALLLASTLGYNQTIQTATYSGKKIIFPTLMNITSLITMTYDQFDALCKQYDYTTSQYPDMYISHLPVGSPLFFITKTPSKAAISWTDEDLNLSSLRDELQQYYEEGENGRYVYSLSIQGKKYQIILRQTSLAIYPNK
jgi:hypothetical protein